MPERASHATQGIDGIANAIAGLPQCASGTWNASHDHFIFHLRPAEGQERGRRGGLRSDGAISITMDDDSHDEGSSWSFLRLLRPHLGEAAEVVRVRDLRLNGSGVATSGRHTNQRQALTEALRNRRRDSVTAQAIEGRTAQSRAVAALSHWICDEPVSGLYEALLPDEVLGQIEEEDARAVARALRGTGQSSSFIARWLRARREQGLATADIADDQQGAPAPDEAKALLRSVLLKLWPTWEGWAAPPPLTHTMDEYVYDLHTASFWNVALRQQMEDEAVDADIFRHAWPSIAVNGREVSMRPSEWMKSRDSDHVVDAVARIPGRDRFVLNVVFEEHGSRYAAGRKLLNTWRPGPDVEPDAPDAGPWLDLARRLFEGKAWQDSFGSANPTLNAVLDRFAWIVQHPGDPLQGVIALLGEQGVGKDALLLPLAHAVGWWNTGNVLPDELVARFNPFIERDLVIVNEVRMVHSEGSAHHFYSILKSIAQRPPYTIKREEKNIRAREVPKTASYIITSNEATSLYIPDDDRRYFIPEIRLKAGWPTAAGQPDYFTRYFDWLNQQRGYAAVHRFLGERDLSRFDPNAPPPDSTLKRRVQAAAAEGDTELTWAIEKLGDPDGFFEVELRDLANGVGREGGVRNPELLATLHNRKSQQLSDRLERLGYVLVPPPAGNKKWEARVPVGEVDGAQVAPYKASHKAYIRSQRAGEPRGHLVGWLLERLAACAVPARPRPNRMPPAPADSTEVQLES